MGLSGSWAPWHSLPARGPARNIWAIGGIGGVAYSMAAMSVIGKICIYCAGVDTLILLYVVYSIFGGGEPDNG
jgi:hypothetical protein